MLTHLLRTRPGVRRGLVAIAATATVALSMAAPAASADPLPTAYKTLSVTFPDDGRPFEIAVHGADMPRGDWPFTGLTTLYYFEVSCADGGRWSFPVYVSPYTSTLNYYAADVNSNATDGPFGRRLETERGQTCALMPHTPAGRQMVLTDLYGYFLTNTPTELMSVSASLTTAVNPGPGGGY